MTPSGSDRAEFISALGAVGGEGYTAHHLPCLNPALPAAKKNQLRLTVPNIQACVMLGLL